MGIRISGYLRDNPGGVAVPGKTVSLLDVNTNLAPVTNSHTNLSSTTDVTDAQGFWEFTMDLGTGPLYVSADLGGGDVRQRRNDELFNYGPFNINQLPVSLRSVNDGVIERRTPGGSALTDLVATPSATRILTISSGYAIIRGNVVGWDSGNKTLTGSANGAAGTTRHDFVVLRQWYSGVNQGKQDLVLVEGGSSTDPVATTTESDLTKFIRGANIWDLPIARGKLAFGATVYTVEDLRGVWPYPFAGQMSTGDVGALIAQSAAISGALAVTGDASLKGTNVQVTSAGLQANTPILIGSYVKSNTTSPAVSANAVSGKAGTGATASISGTDRCGQITLNMGSSPGAGRQLTVTMDTTMPDTSYEIFLQGIEDTAITNQGKHRALSINTTQWEIEALATPGTNQHKWRYLVEAR